MASFVRLDKLQASVAGNIESVVHTAELQNGMVVTLGGFHNGEREVRDVATVGALTDEILLVASPEVMYDERLSRNLNQFVIPAGREARAYHLNVGDYFTVSADGLTGTLAVDKFVVPVVGELKLDAVTAPGGTERFVGKIVLAETMNDTQVYMIQVISA